MDFTDALKQFCARVETLYQGVGTEEATKMSLIVPFFQLLGYDIFNPTEFCPEFTADVGIKKGEKVDYAILQDGKPVILIECKWCGDNLEKHSSQLYRYFGTTAAKFGILTNGIVYKFYTDLEESNKMDLTPFLEINLLDLKDGLINELKKFCKTNFDKESIFSTASELKYSSLIKDLLRSEMENPTDSFVRCILADIYEGQKTQKVIDKFKPIVKKSMNAFINDLINQKISSALNTSEQQDQQEEPLPTEAESKIVTTQEELDAFYIVRGLLVGVVEPENVTHRDTESYFGILYKDNNRKPICRVNFNTKQKQLLVPDENKSFTRYYLEKVSDIYLHKDALIDVVKRYL